MKILKNFRSAIALFSLFALASTNVLAQSTATPSNTADTAKVVTENKNPMDDPAVVAFLGKYTSYAKKKQQKASQEKLSDFKREMYNYQVEANERKAYVENVQTAANAANNPLLTKAQSDAIPAQINDAKNQYYDKLEETRRVSSAQSQGPSQQLADNLEQIKKAEAEKAKQKKEDTEKDKTKTDKKSDQ